MPQSEHTARIILEDGTEFEGIPFGHESSVSGEIVFYTGEAGIPQLATDPALRGAILVIAQPSAGNAGVVDDAPCALGLETQFESSSAQIAGLILPSLPDDEVRQSTRKPLGKWLKKQQIPGIAGIDTRALIQRLTLRGSMRAKILVSGTKEVSFSSAGGHNQPVNVSTRRTIEYGTGPKRIILVDCGTRNSVIRAVVTPDTTVVRIPCTHDYSKDAFDGILIAGGPGDPTSCEKTIAVLKAALAKGKPVFAVGQGAVILAIACGASAYRMANGHRSPAVPCLDLETGRCLITAQNHGYGIRDESLPKGWNVTFINNNDRTIAGFQGPKGLVSGVIFQPEGQPGSRDTSFLYTRFISLVNGEGAIK